MSSEMVLKEARALPFAEQVELCRNLWNDIVQSPKLTPEHKAELDRRAEELRQHPERGIPWETVQAELHERLKSRKA